MRRTSVIAAAVGSLLVSSSSFAAFTFTAVKTDVGGLDQVEVFALNDGVGTGTKLAAVNLVYNGSGAVFNFGDLDDDTSTPDEVDLPNAGNAANKGFLRIGTAANSFVVGASLKIGGTAAPTTDPRWGTAVTNFEAAYAFSGAPVAANTGTGARFARFFIPDGGSFTLTGTIGGDTGSEVPLSINYGTTVPPTNSAPVVAAGSTANVSFGSIVSNGAPFSVVVNVTDADAADVLALTVGSVAGISNVAVTGGGTSPEAFTVTGTVDYSLNGTTVVVPVTATDGALTGTGSFSLVVTPEPASLSLLGLAGLAFGRRRK